MTNVHIHPSYMFKPLAVSGAFLAVAPTGNWIADLILNGVLFGFIVTITFKASARLQKIEDKLEEHARMFKDRQIDADELRSEIKHLFLESPSANVRHRVLLVEDDKNDEILFRRILSPSFEVKVARSLAEAHVMLDAEVVDCTLLDLTLPDTKREETVIAFLAKHPAALCLAMSGYDGIESLALKQGADSFLKKDNMTRAYVERMIKHAIIRHRSQEKS